TNDHKGKRHRHYPGEGIKRRESRRKSLQLLVCATQEVLFSRALCSLVGLNVFDVLRDIGNEHQDLRKDEASEDEPGVACWFHCKDLQCRKRQEWTKAEIEPDEDGDEP